MKINQSIKKIEKPKKTEKIAFLLIIICTILISVAQILYKKGINNIELNIISILNPLILSGMILYGLGALMMILALKKGEVSSVYPFLGTSYILVNVLAWFFLGEPFNEFKLIGTILILIGVGFIGRATK